MGGGRENVDHILMRYAYRFFLLPTHTGSNAHRFKHTKLMIHTLSKYFPVLFNQTRARRYFRCARANNLNTRAPPLAKPRNSSRPSCASTSGPSYHWAWTPLGARTWCSWRGQLFRRRRDAAAGGSVGGSDGGRCGRRRARWDCEQGSRGGRLVPSPHSSFVCVFASIPLCGASPRYRPTVDLRGALPEV